MEITMGNRTKNKRIFKIIYNPYRKEMKYQVKNEGEKSWNELGNNSKLIQSEFSKNIILQHDGMKILKLIREKYNPQEIIFEGTEEDYQDLKSIIDNFYGKDICCKKGACYLKSPQNVLSEIEKKFNQLDRTFEDYNSPEIRDIISKFKDVLGVEIPIFVMGTYSAGKSAFINAIIGAEILPSRIDTTTAKTYKIMEAMEDRGEVKFLNGKKEIKVEFSKNKEYSVSKEIDEELKIMIARSLGKNSSETVTSQLFYCISAINYYAKKILIKLVILLRFIPHLTVCLKVIRIPLYSMIRRVLIRQKIKSIGKY